VLLLADQHHHALLDRGVGDLPVHLQLFGERTEFVAELGEVEGQRVGLDLDTHEVAPELARVERRLGVQRGLEDPALMLGDEARDLGDDADAVGAGGREGEEAFSVHGASQA